MNAYLMSLLLSATVISQIEASTCYKNWSRCTPQTSFWTGILWKTCSEYCQKCGGRESGGCRRVNNKECSGGYQCQCSGRNIRKSSDWMTKITCKMGL
ncbi:unnamed protein product, partial [Mesorhabditis belari]|uniref:Theromacin n=1 Tax=Mesorhabditis belari TaxID=2138241 RepID=A0AAF3FKZ1_9BILA